jgi:exopolyphosphatase / guanosine-5'-triphosphate,3'-diphosphate pyrophosphatase
LKVGIIDMGSNTFNLLIAEIGDDGSYQPLYRSKIAVKLGEGGFMKNYITEEAMERAVVALHAQISRIKAEYCDRIHAFATSAVRNATNAGQFTSKMKELFGITINVISGDKEAAMVYNGVRLAGALGKEKCLIMDIGGGSTEFIIADENEVLWQRSYELGVSRLMEKFKPSDPLSPADEQQLDSFLEKEVDEMIEQTKVHGVKLMIGSSGSFDTFCDVLSERKGNYAEVSGKSSVPFDFEALQKILDEIVASSLSQREAMPHMPEYRVRMIVISALFARMVLRKTGIERVNISRYSLKEGVLFDVLKGNI